ncbi:unnamed protein product [Amoebophrya sp. A25]|nr:unnamed protein product [Amoebophrya sp. A25]|eukprot:GSA25T00013499001.1
MYQSMSVQCVAVQFQTAFLGTRYTRNVQQRTSPIAMFIACACIDLWEMEGRCSW